MNLWMPFSCVSPHLLVASLSLAFNIFMLFVSTIKNIKKNAAYFKSVTFLINLFFILSHQTQFFFHLI